MATPGKLNKYSNIKAQGQALPRQFPTGTKQAMQKKKQQEIQANADRGTHLFVFVFNFLFSFLTVSLISNHL